jgi:hypothetical protein
VRPSKHAKIRELLLASEDGLTIKQLEQLLQAPDKSVQKSISKIWGVYIDRWQLAPRGQFASVWMCVNVPDNTPRPKKKNTCTP